MSDIVLWIIIISLTCVLLYLICRGIGNLILWFANIRLELHNKNMDKESSRIAIEKKRYDILQVRPDQNGYLPVLLNSLEDIQGRVLNHIDMSIGGPKIQTQPLLPLQPIIQNTENTDFFYRWKNNKLPKNGQIWLGKNRETGEDFYTTLDELHSILISGIPDFGKSTFARLILAQALLQGSKFAIIDPHLGAGEDSLGASFETLQGYLFSPIARTENEQLATINLITKELMNRLTGKSTDKTPLLLVTDETNQMLENPAIGKALIDALNKIVNQGRKVFVYALSVGQNFHSHIMTTSVRNSYISIFSVASRSDVAKLISNSYEFAQITTKLIKGEIAYYKYGMSSIVVLNTPNITSKDMQMISFGMRQKPKEITTQYEWIDENPLPATSNYGKDSVRNPLPNGGENYQNGSGVEVAGSGEKAASNLDLEVVKTGIGSGDARKQRVKRMLRIQTPFTEIIKSEWGATGGNDYQKASKELRSIIAELLGG